MSAAPSEIAIRGRGGRLALPAASDVVPFGAAAAAVLPLGLARGGYYATTWSIATVAALSMGAVAVVRMRGVRSGGAFLFLLLGFAAWVAVESVRPGAATHGMPELERDVLYLAFTWTALQLVSRKSAATALRGLLSAILGLLAVGLYDVLRPFHITADAYEGRLLFQPLGYANGCGVLASIGVVVALGLVSRRRTAAAVALAPLTVALVLTQSRGAELALAVGLAALAALHPERQRLVGTGLSLLPIPAAAAVFALHSHVTDPAATSALVARDCVVVAATTVGAALAQIVVARRLHIRVSLPELALGGLAALVLAAALGGAALGSGDRAAYWRVAWHDAAAHPLLGSGPGTFAREWLAHRTTAVGVQNAHSLYLETLAELGPVGLLLLLAALAAPLIAVWRRRTPTGAAAAAAYAVFLAHAAVDWDWQLPAVTVAGLLCGVCALRAAAPEASPARRPRVPALAIAGALAVAAAAAGVGNDAIAAAARYAQVGATADAARSARFAAEWQPWSAEPRRMLAELAAAAGNRAQSRRYLAAALQRDPADAAAWYDALVAARPAQRQRALERLAQLDPLVVRAEAP